MILHDTHKHAFPWLIVIAAILSMVIASCSTTGRSSQPQAPGSALGYQPASALSGASSAGIQKGKELYDTLACAGCHVINGQGGKVGPDLSNEAKKGRSRSWLTTKMRNPKADDPQTLMPAYGTLSDQQVNDLVDYMLSLTTGKQAGAAAARGLQGLPTVRAVSSSSVTVGAVTVSSVGGGARGPAPVSPIAAGATLWSQRCGQCHNLRPASEYSDAQWAVAMHHMRVRVPLTGEEQRNILAFLQASN